MFKHELWNKLYLKRLKKEGLAMVVTSGWKKV